MNSLDYGFYFGLVPGVAYFFQTMFRVRRVLAQAKALAREQGEFLDMDSSENQNFDFLLFPEKFIKPGDGPGVRRGKELLLSIRPDMMRRHWIALVLIILGVFLGIGIASGIGALMM